ncbi:hypothetical protein V7968_31440 [Nocardia vulneris]|uniref:hypothetical protein n=1 Tax=Nocardia vulneris TaxID=1141657 RepID=UPI0030D019C3
MTRRDRSKDPSNDRRCTVDVVFPDDPPVLNPNAAKALLRLILRCAEERRNTERDAKSIVHQRLTDIRRHSQPPTDAGDNIEYTSRSGSRPADRRPIASNKRADTSQQLDLMSSRDTAPRS